MAKTDTVTSPRLAAIADRIFQTCSGITGALQEISEASDIIQTASASANNTRIAVATELAALSHAEQWTATEVTGGTALAVKKINSQDSTAKTLGVFISEMNTFANPKVREHFPVVLTSCQEAWAEEQEYLASLEPDERKGADTPVRKYKARIYHLVTDIARQVKGAKLVVSDKSDVIQWARDHDPDQDADKISKRLAKIIGDIDGIYGDFGLEELKVAADYLRTVTAKELLAARETLQGAQPAEGLLKPAPGAQPPAAVRAPQAPPPSPAPSMADGAADLDELMNDTANLLAAA